MNYSLDQFSPLVNAVFSVRDETGVENEAVLIEAVPARSGGAAESPGEPFSLLFRLAPDATLAQAPRQGTYQVSPPSLEPANLFLVPVKADADGVYYEAVFN